MLVRSAHHPELLMRMLASGHRRGNPDGGSPAVTVARRAWGAPSGVQWDQPQRESRAPEEDRVVGANPPITSILPDEGWAPLLEIIVRDAPPGSVIEVNMVGTQALAECMLHEVSRQDVTVELRPLRVAPLPPAQGS